MSAPRYMAARVNPQRSPRGRAPGVTWVDGVRGIAYCFAAFLVVERTLRVASRMTDAALRRLRQ